MNTSTQPDIEPVEHLKEMLVGIEEKVVTGYTLANAIREGCMVTDKLEGGFIKGDSACTLTAGWIAAKSRGYIVEE